MSAQVATHLLPAFRAIPELPTYLSRIPVSVLDITKTNSD